MAPASFGVAACPSSDVAITGNIDALATADVRLA